MGSVIGCERSVITITLLFLGYIVHNFDNYAMTLPTETGLMILRGIYTPAVTQNISLYPIIIGLS